MSALLFQALRSVNEARRSLFPAAELVGCRNFDCRVPVTASYEAITARIIDAQLATNASTKMEPIVAADSQIPSSSTQSGRSADASLLGPPLKKPKLADEPEDSSNSDSGDEDASEQDKTFANIVDT